MLFPEKTQLASATDRRKVIGTLGLAGLGMLASTSTASAFTSAASPKVTVQTRPARKRHRPSGRRSVSATFLKNGSSASGVCYRNTLAISRGSISSPICPKQVIAAHAKSKGSIWNTLPPKAWWTRMGYTLACRRPDRPGNERA